MSQGGTSQDRSPLNVPQWIISASLGTRVLTDLAISGAMVAMLRRQRTGFRRLVIVCFFTCSRIQLFDRTDSILDLLVSFAINTGEV